MVIAATGALEGKGLSVAAREGGTISFFIPDMFFLHHIFLIKNPPVSVTVEMGRYIVLVIMVQIPVHKMSWPDDN